MHMIVEIELMIEVKSQVVQNRFRGNNRAFYRREINRRVERVLSSCKVEEFGFAVFYNKACIKENFRHDVITTK